LDAVVFGWALARVLLAWELAEAWRGGYVGRIAHCGVMGRILDQEFWFVQVFGFQNVVPSLFRFLNFCGWPFPAKAFIDPLCPFPRLKMT